MASHLTKVYCRMQYPDGSEGPGYTHVCRDGWDIGIDGNLITATFNDERDLWEVRTEGYTFVALIDKRTWRKLAKKNVPLVLRAENANDLDVTSAR